MHISLYSNLIEVLFCYRLQPIRSVKDGQQDNSAMELEENCVEISAVPTVQDQFEVTNNTENEIEVSFTFWDNSTMSIIIYCEEDWDFFTVISLRKLTRIASN